MEFGRYYRRASFILEFMPSNVVDVQVSQIPRHRMGDNRDAGVVVQKQNGW